MKTALWTPLAALVLCVNAHAAATLYQHAHVVTARGPVLADAAVLIVDGRIKAIGERVEAPAGSAIVDARGQWITPALFGGVGSMGVVEIGAEQSTNDSSLNLGDVRPEFDPALAFNPDSEPVEIARVEGIGFALLAPEPGRHAHDGNVIAGLADVVTLDGHGPHAPSALVVTLGHSGGELAGDNRAGAFLVFADALDEARHPPKPGEPRRLTEAGRATLREVIVGRTPVLFQVDRASDIRAVLAFSAQQHLHPIIAGGAEAWRVAADLARAHVPVVVDPFDDLPADFDRIAATLENAARLDRAGVTVAFSLRGSAPHEARKLRQGAGNAVAHGMPWDRAFAAISATPARLFGAGDEWGVLDTGHTANLVVWSGDPLEVTSRVQAQWLDGTMRSLNTRQTALRDRYVERLRRGAAR
jgi:Amidohydrolase family